MSIRGKLAATFGLILLIWGSAMGFLIYNMNITDKNYNNLIDNRIRVKERALALSNNFTDSGYSLRGYLLTGDNMDKDSYDRSITVVNLLIAEIGSKLESLEERSIFENIGGKLAGYEKYAKDLIKLKEAGKTEEIIRYSQENSQLLNGVNNAVDEFVKFEEKLVGQNSTQTTAKVKQVTFMSMAAALAVLIVGLVVAFLMSRAITRPLGIISQKAGLIAAGDLTADDIAVRSRDELGQVTKSFNQMKYSLSEFVSKITGIAERLSEQSTHLAAQAQQTSAGAGATAATTGEIAGTVEQVAQNAREVALAASVVATHAGDGQTGLEQISTEIAGIAATTVDVQKSINELAGDIGSVNQFVDVITNIAEQTSLLALNAAIEAARAGEYGRGFSVVAEEVRKLADESSRSAMEIRQVIERVSGRSGQAVRIIADGSERVAQGSKVIGEVSASLAGIIDLTRGLTDQVQSVAAAAQQVSSGVQNMAATAQQQTAAMEEVTASAENLSSLAVDLRDMSGKFRL